MLTSPMPTSPRLQRLLDAIERGGNRLPDPAMLFAALLAVVFLLSALLASVEFSALHPATGQPLQLFQLEHAKHLSWHPVPLAPGCHGTHLREDHEGHDLHH